MLEAERHQLILNLLNEKNSATLRELVELTHSSESTIRRDLTQLEQDKFLKRVHGGAARLQGKLQESNMAEKSTKNLQEKQVIGQYAGHLVQKGDCVYLDAGSTVFEMIPYLPTDIVVVTNGMTHVDQLLDKNIKTFLIGGYAKPTTKAIIGRGALESLEHYRFDKCFIGANGIHHQFGYTTPDQEEAMIKQQAIALAREAYVLADESKFSEIAFAKIANLQAATIITNELNRDHAEQLNHKTKIKVATR